MAVTAICIDCTATVSRKGTKGKLPKRCPEHAAKHGYNSRKAWRLSHPESVKAYQKNWSNRNPDAATSKTLLHKYGISLDGYNALLAKQGGRCANLRCLAEKPEGRGRFHVDHDHATGKVRGLLCATCNIALGMSGDGYANARILGLYEYAEYHGPTRSFEPGISEGLL